MGMIYDGHVYRAMTPEEEAESRRLQVEAAQTPPTPTDAERIAALEDQLAAMQSAYSRGVQDA